MGQSQINGAQWQWYGCDTSHRSRRLRLVTTPISKLRYCAAARCTDLRVNSDRRRSHPCACLLHYVAKTPTSRRLESSPLDQPKSLTSWLQVVVHTKYYSTPASLLSYLLALIPTCCASWLNVLPDHLLSIGGSTLDAAFTLRFRRNTFKFRVSMYDPRYGPRLSWCHHHCTYRKRKGENRSQQNPWTKTI